MYEIGGDKLTSEERQARNKRREQRAYALQGSILDEASGEAIQTGDVLFAETMQAVLAALDVESVTVKRRIFDRNGRRPLASIEYSPAAFAAKLGDGYLAAYSGNGGKIEERG